MPENTTIFHQTAAIDTVVTNGGSASGRDINPTILYSTGPNHKQEEKVSNTWTKLHRPYTNKASRTGRDTSVVNAQYAMKRYAQNHVAFRALVSSHIDSANTGFLHVKGCK